MKTEHPEGELEVFYCAQCDGLEVQNIADQLDEDALTIVIECDRDDEPTVYYVLRAANNPANYMDDPNED